MSASASPYRSSRRWATVPPGTAPADFSKWSKWAASTLVPAIKSFVHEFGPRSLPHKFDATIDDYMFHHLSSRYTHYDLHADQVTFEAPLAHYPLDDTNRSDLPEVRVKVHGVSLPTSIVDPVIEWTPHRQTRQGLILLPPDSTTPVQDMAGPRCVEFYEDVRTPTYNRGVDDFVKDFALGQLGGTTANQPYKYLTADNNHWESLDRMNVAKTEATWKVHLRTSRIPVLVTFTLPVNPHHVVAR